MDDTQLELALAQRRARIDALAETWLRGPASPGYRAMCGAWAMAVAVRFTLPEAAQPSWWAPMMVQSVAAVGLVVYGGRVWWALAAAGVFVPLAWFGDWLTQSTLMLMLALVGVATASARPAARAPQAARTAARALVAATYGIAAFHKLNTGFLDPIASCAGHGLRQLGALTATVVPDPAALGVSLPVAVLVTEVAICALLVFRPRAGVVLGGLFHIPLTVALAPAFAFVMAIGWAAALSDDDWRAIGRVARRWRGTVVRVALLAWLGAWWWVGAGPLGGPLAALKVVALLSWSVLALVAWRTAKPGAGTGSATRAERVIALAAACAWGALAAAPYLGTQMQHSGAMLSNLRVDTPCANHLLVPSRASADPYVRIDEVSIGDHAERFAELEQTVLDTLWSPYALRQMRANWCAESTRPVRLGGTYRGAPLVIADLCAPQAELPPSRGLLGGDALFDGAIRWQKNLPRTCDAACVH